MERIFASFPQILNAIGTNSNVREAFVFAAWRQSVGSLLDEQTVPMELTGSRLFIAVSGNPWKRHLEDMAGQILARLNSKLGDSSVQFLEFVIDENAVAAHRPAHIDDSTGKDDQADAEILNDVSDAASAICNEELKEAFLLAAESCLRRKNRLMNMT